MTDNSPIKKSHQAKGKAMTNALADLGFGANQTEVKPNHTVSIDEATGKVTIVIDAKEIAKQEPNNNGNKVLNVYHKFNPKLKFSGNLILKG